MDSFSVKVNSNVAYIDIDGYCSTSGYNATIHAAAKMNGYLVKITGDTYTIVHPEPGQTLEVLTGEAFTTSYSSSVSGTWQTNGLYSLSQVKLSHIENSTSASVLDIYLHP